MPEGHLMDCQNCHWQAEEVDGVPLLFSTADRESPVFQNYARNYDRIAEDDLHSSLQPLRYLEIQAETLMSYLAPIDGLRVCELGVGRGLLFDHLLSNNPSTLTGVDISLAYLKRYRQPASKSDGRVRLALANAESLPYADEFDLVIASEILEHVLNVGDFLISLHRSLAPGGRVLIRVPYKEDLRQYARQNGCQYPYVHLRTFTRDNLVAMMRGAGFESDRVYYDGQFGARMRRLARSFHPVIKPYLRRLLDSEGTPVEPLKGFIPKLLLEPVTLTAFFTRA